MANEEEKYTADFKARVAKEALEQDKKDLDNLSDKYDVPVSTILTWATMLEKNSPDIFKEGEESEKAEKHIPAGEEVEVEVTDREISDSIEFGAMLDRLNYRRLIFWSLFGMILVVIFILALIEVYQYNNDQIQEQVSAESEYYQLKELREEADEQLNNFGLVDPENNIYRIPIDSAISDVVDGKR